MALTGKTTGADSILNSEYHIPATYIGTRGYESENIVESAGLDTEQFPDVTSGANIEKPQKRICPISIKRKAVNGGLDNNCLSRAIEIIESFDSNEIMDAAINIESLRGLILQLWETAQNATQFHHEILALLESAILSVETLSQEQISVLKEAIKDLHNEVLAQAHVDVIRRRFIMVGFSPLAFLSAIENIDNCD